ncbi:MAG: 4-hydroxy-3-methylbut-2-enyl diphosphate reductase [Gammaproteobacteria bacterium]
MRIKLANPRGFCAGVDRAIEIVKRALLVFGPPIFVRHEVVHNRTVVNNLKSKGAVFVDELNEVPAGATVIFSAHGVSRAVQEEASRRNLRVFDATCPLVTKVHVEVAGFGRKNQEVVLIGHAAHPEVEGTMGQYLTDAGSDDGQIYLIETEADVATLRVKNPSSLAYVTQTTLSVDDTQSIILALKARFPLIQGPRKDDICYATQNRQDAVKQLALESDLVLVVGSPNSSNSNRLRELAERCGARSFLIDGACEIQADWVQGVETVGVTAGASAPEALVQAVVDRLRLMGGLDAIELSGSEENVVFSLPKALRHPEENTASCS